MADRSRSDSSKRESRRGDDAKIESIWREAMLLRQFDRDEVSAARARRSEAEAARRGAEQEALKATHELCEELRVTARAELQKAEDALAEAERLRADAEAEGARAKRDSEAELERARTIRADAEVYGERIETAAREKAEAAVVEAHAESVRIKEDIKSEASEEVRRLLSDIEMARAASQEELETQRILTETARIRAFSPGLAARDAAHDDHSEDDTDEAPPTPGDAAHDDHSEDDAEEVPPAPGDDMKEPVVLEVAEPKNSSSNPLVDSMASIMSSSRAPSLPAAKRSPSAPARKRRRTAKAKKKAA